MLIIESLSFNRNNYDIMERFDDNQSYLMATAMFLLCAFSYYSGISKLLSYFLKNHLQQKRHNDTKIVSFIFSKNHQIVNQELFNLDINYPIYDLSFASISKIESQKVVKFSKFLLFLAAITNGKLYIDSILKCKEDKFVAVNKIKVFKLAGYEFIYQNLLNELTTVVKFNDHIYNSYLLYEIAVQKQLKTVYIQHAPVSETFPALHHDLNVLFSQDSISKYDIENESKKIFEFVDIRLLTNEKYSNNFKTESNLILIAFNPYDDLNKIKELIDGLSEDYSFLLRPHPLDKRNFQFLEKIENVSFSIDSSIWEDLNRAEFVLCNETAVPLEAMFLNKKVYKVPFFHDSFDNYSFISKGLITKEFENIIDLKKALDNKEICFNLEKLTFFIGDFSNLKLLAKDLKLEIESLINK